MISAQSIKELREKTGAGVSDVKRALEESGGDMQKAEAVLERKLGSSAEKRAGRETAAGVVDSYIHSNGAIGALVELLCETDFVARNSEFRALAHDIALHIAAMRPLYVSLDAVPPEVWAVQEEQYATQVAAMEKPAAIKKEIVDGKLKAHFGAICLLSQAFVKDPDKAVGDMINEASGRFGERVRVGRFARFAI